MDLYRFIEKVVRNPGQVKIRRKVALGNQAEKILGVVQDERIDLVVLAVRKTTFLSNGSRKVVENDFEISLPCAAQAVL